MRSKTSLALVLSTLLAFSLAGCGKKEAPAPKVAVPPPAPVAQDVVNVPVSVKSVTLGNALTDGKVASASTSFAPHDTIYAVVETVGSGDASLKAAWTYHKGDQTASVNETTQDIKASGPAHTEFHMSKPDGWPAGDYKVEVFLNGGSAGSQTFTVK